MEDPDHQVTIMFVKHCPDPSLHTALRGRPLEKWIVGEVQELMDSHHRERQSARACQTQNIVKADKEMSPSAWCKAQQPVVSANQSTNTEPASLSKVICLMEKILAMQGKVKIKPEPACQSISPLQPRARVGSVEPQTIQPRPTALGKACASCVIKQDTEGKKVNKTNVVTSHVQDPALN